MIKLEMAKRKNDKTKNKKKRKLYRNVLRNEVSLRDNFAHINRNITVLH